MKSKGIGGIRMLTDLRLQDSEAVGVLEWTWKGHAVEMDDAQNRRAVYFKLRSLGNLIYIKKFAPLNIKPYFFGFLEWRRSWALMISCAFALLGLIGPDLLQFGNVSKRVYCIDLRHGAIQYDITTEAGAITFNYDGRLCPRFAPQWATLQWRLAKLPLQNLYKLACAGR